MANRKQRRHSGKPQGMTYADQLARKRVFKEAAQNAANNTMVQLEAEAQVQKAQWLMILALNDTDQYGKIRYERLADGMIKRSEWYEKLVEECDEDFAVGKLQEEVERVTRQQVELAWDKEIREARKKHENDILTNYERLRTSGVEKMAATLCGWLDCVKCPGREFCSHNGGRANGLVEWLKREEARE